jgi:hypothetical protein
MFRRGKRTVQKLSMSSFRKLTTLLRIIDCSVRFDSFSTFSRLNGVLSERVIQVSSSSTLTQQSFCCYVVGSFYLLGITFPKSRLCSLRNMVESSSLSFIIPIKFPSFTYIWQLWWNSYTSNPTWREFSLWYFVSSPTATFFFTSYTFTTT